MTACDLGNVLRRWVLWVLLLGVELELEPELLLKLVVPVLVLAPAPRL